MKKNMNTMNKWTRMRRNKKNKNKMQKLISNNKLENRLFNNTKSKVIVNIQPRLIKVNSNNSNSISVYKLIKN